MYGRILSMDFLHDFISQSLFTLAPAMRNVLIFLFSFGEGLPIIGSLLPGGTIALLVGSLSKEGYINPWTAIHLIALGSFIGDMVGFVLGRYMQKFAYIQKIINADKHKKKWDLFDRHAALVIIFGKLLPVIRSTPGLFAGVRKMDIWRYVIYVGIGSYVWAIGGVFGGNFLAQVLGENAIPIIILAFILLGGITFIINNYIKKKKYPQSL